jgi:RNA recognition motif-containing protein
MTSVVASNLGQDGKSSANMRRMAANMFVLVTEKQVTDFFSFCGKIQSLTMEADGAEKQKAIITFERPSAARTALLLQDAHLGTSQVHVSTSIPLDGASTPPSLEHKREHDFSQEDKPRTAVAAGISIYVLCIDTDYQNTCLTDIL